ncbi:MAG: hypothetical protein ACOYKE_03505 [Ferruginibacter sp.]
MSNINKTALIIGASGLTGTALLNRLLKDDRYRVVYILVRKNIPLEHPKLVQIILNLMHRNRYR